MLTSAETETPLGAAVERTLRYAGFFRYPLTAAEIRRGCEVSCTDEDVLRYLNDQVASGRCQELRGYYSLGAGLPDMLQRRLEGNARAARDIPKAVRCGAFIYRFPFVRFVGISGSLSKGFSDERSDFDFFVITAGNRLWLCRTILHVFKKLTFLIGRQHDFCMNYFIDEHELTLQEQNIYTATELRSIIPVCGSSVYQRFVEANGWVFRVLPNAEPADAAGMLDAEKPFKRLLTAVFNALFPDAVDTVLMKLTDLKWRRKWARKGYPAADYPLAFKTTRHVSKNHPANYQKRILQAISPNET